MEIYCAYCNRLFEPSNQVKLDIKKNPNKPRFCSRACLSKFNGNKLKCEQIKFNCINCGKEFILSADQRIKFNKGERNLYCSKSCSGKAIMSNKDVITKRNNNAYKTKLDRYGNGNYNNIAKIQATMINKYGKPCIFQTEEFKIKSKNTKLKKYEDINYNNRELFLKTYKNRSEADNQVLRKIKQVNTKQAIANRTEEQWEKIKNKLSISNTKAWKSMTLDKKLNIRKSQSISQKNRWKRMSEQDKIKLFKKCKITTRKRYGVDYVLTLESVQQKARQNNGYTVSKTNMKIRDTLLHDIGIKFELEKDGFDMVYDNIALEIDPTFSHNSLFSYAYAVGKTTSNIPLDKQYHMNKSYKALTNDYRCIHIFDWDDLDKIEYLIKPKQTLYARNLAPVFIDKDICDKFLNDYHIQSTCRGQDVRLGLYDSNGVLVQVMTFGKPRYTRKYEWELLRLCSHKDYKIVGGAEKLFKLFVDKYSPASIISYCDFSKFTGDVYTKLGFNKKSISINKHWSRKNEHITDNLLRQRGYDQLFGTNYGKGTSNEQLMIDNGWLPVYDAGQITFVWNNTTEN